jgi:hypothetical protein
MNKQNFIKMALVAALATFSFFSCKKDSTSTTTTTTPTGTLVLHLHTNVDTNEVDFYDTVYHLAQMFISHIQVVRLDGSVYEVPGVSILKVMENEEYVIGSVPVGNYKSVNFSVGLDASTNANSPTSGSIFNTPAMWFNSSFSSSDGYVFVNFQGKIDTTTNANGTVANMQPFTYKIGTNAHLTNINMPEQDFSVTANQQQFVHIIIDYSKLLTGVQLNQSANLAVNSVSANSSTIANKVAANISTLFHYE